MAGHTYSFAFDVDTSSEENSKPMPFDVETSSEENYKLMPTDIAIGIDIGTSKCCVAVWNGSQVELLRNTRNQRLFCSYVLFKDETASGGVSTEVPLGDPEILSGRADFNMKRLIGRIDTDPVVQASKTPPFMVQTLGIGLRPFIAALENNVWRSNTPEEILASCLHEVKVMAAVQLKRLIRNAVLTVPVSFSRFQLTRIERACAMAGINVIRMMPEPTAVALLYAQQQQQSLHYYMENPNVKYALIFNMGAGYCDVAVTETKVRVSRILALLGIPLGGEDILQNILRYLLPDFESFCSNHSPERIKSMALLRIAAENAIHELSSQTRVEINVDLGNGNKLSRSLTRAEFEEVNREVFVKCKKLVSRCLLDAWLLPDDLNDVILVGGCSSIPKIRSLVLGACAKGDSYKGIDPLEGAVHGAAMEGAIASGITDPSGSLNLQTIQATPLSLGIRVDGDGFAPIIHRYTAVPARKEMLFTTAHDNQTEALIVVYEGESEKAEENNILGYFKITGIPSAPKGSAEICVCMDVDASNVLRVCAGAFLLGTQQAVSPFLEVRMPTIDDGNGWCWQALVRMYGTTMDLNTIPKKV